MRQRFSLYVIVALLPLVALAAGLGIQTLRQQHAAMEQEAVGAARAILDGVEHELHYHLDVLSFIALSPALDPAEPNLALLGDIVARFAERYPLWQRVILHDAQGRMLFNSRAAADEPLPPARDPESLERVIASGQPVIGNYSLRGNIAARAPVRRAGEMTYILTVVLSPRELAGLTAAARVDSKWHPKLADAAGTIVAAPRAPSLIGTPLRPAALDARRTAHSGLYGDSMPDGEDAQAAFVKSTALGWSAHISIPHSVYQAPLYRLLAVLVSATLLVAILTAAFIWVLRRDVAAARREDAARQLSSRMEAVGRMTGRVAHDFNNLLMVLLGNLSLLERRARVPGAERYISAMRQAAEQAGELTKQLLSFSRGRTEAVAVGDVNDRVRRMEPLLRQATRENILVELDLEPDLPPARFESAQFEMALLNVAINARDAMPDGGSLRIRTSLGDLPGRRGERAIVIELRDSGTGVPEDILPHVFEPFYTTKGGHGSGLGLSQVYGFARASGGEVTMTSEAGRGATVTIHLPVAEGVRALAPAQRRTQPEFSSAGRQNSVLIIDDNDEVRAVTAESLLDRGFTVVEVSSAEAALNMLETRTFDAVVSDIVMPGMDGIALAQELGRRFPALPVVLISGYTDSWQAAAELGLPVLRKPFALGDLAASILAAIARSESNRAQSRA